MLQGRVTNIDDPMNVSLRGMTSQLHLLNIAVENIAYADVPGYQKKEAVVTTFAEQLGFKGINKVVNTEAGRVTSTDKPLDLALITKGYFQKLQKDGSVELTRDGRFKVDKQGNLLSENDMPILSRHGMPINLGEIPNNDFRSIKIQRDGTIQIVDAANSTTRIAGQIAVASEDGLPLEEVDMRQGNIEASNVFLHEEFVAVVSPRRLFEANRQIFQIQSQALSKLVQELDRAQ